MLRVLLLGQPQLLFEGKALHVGGRPKAIPLLAYAVLHAREPVHRNAVASALWPDDPDSAARANLRRHLLFLRELLPPAGGAEWLATTASTLQWNGGNRAFVDVLEFERLAAAPDTAAAAVELYRGDLLAPYEEEWAAADRERLHATYVDLLASLARSARSRRAFAESLRYLERLQRCDPWREDAIRLLMLVHSERGDGAGAIAAYERFARDLEAELGVEPMPETHAVYDAIRRGVTPPGTLVEPADTAAGSSPAPDTLLPFAGRERELATLGRVWTDAITGRSRLVLLGGEAGVGKTRLMREFAARCESEGGRILSAAVSHPERTPYEPIAAILRGIEPLIVSGEAPAANDFERERIRFFERCAAAIRTVSDRAPTLLVLEDVHWAGAATLALVEYLARRLAGSRLLIVATYREDDVPSGHPLRELRRTCDQEQLGTTLPLSRLDRTAVTAIVERAAQGESLEVRMLAERLYERSEGNAFFLGQLVQDLVERDVLAAEGSGWLVRGTVEIALPTAVRETLDRRVTRLDDAARRLAETAAVAGRSFTVELMAAATGGSEAGVLDALDTLIDHRLVAESGANDFEFTHQLVQSAVYDAIPPDRRRRRHHRIARVLEELYSRDADRLAAEIGTHYERAGESALAAVRFLTAAQRAFASYAAVEAAEYAGRALTLAADDATRFDAVLVRNRIAALAGDRASQARDVAELESLASTLDFERELIALLRRADLANVTSDVEAERAAIAALRSRIGDADDPGWQAELLVADARLARKLGDFSAARTACDRSIELAERHGDRRGFLAAHLARADTYIFEGRLAEARGCLDEIRSIVDEDRDRLGYVRALMTFARAALAQQDYDAMTQFAREALTIARSIGDREGEALAMHTIANGGVYAFAVRETRESYEEAARAYREIGHRLGRAGILADYGLFNIEIGLLERGLELSGQAVELCEAIGYAWTACVAKINAGYAHRLCGEPRAAADSALQALELARSLRSQQLEAAALGTLGFAETELGDHSAAIEHLRAGIALRRPAGPTPRLGDNLCGLARAQLRSHDLAGAAEAAAELVSLYESNPALAPQPTEWLGTCAAVALACGDDMRADDLHARAVAVMEARAAAIDDAATRSAFLELPFNRDLLAVSGEPRRSG